MKSPIPIEMFFHREKGAKTLQARLVSAIVQAILDTRARPGTPMPSTRELARELSISRMTVTLVYQDLVGMGYLETVPRSGVVVADTVPHRRREIAPALHDKDAPIVPVDWDDWLSRPRTGKRVIRKPADWRDYRYCFIFGQSDPQLFDHGAWRDCARRTWGTRDFDELAADQYGRDDAMLVDYICSHTLPRRGIQASPDEVLVTLGAQNALYLTIDLLARPDRITVTEEPGYPDFSETLRRVNSPVNFVQADSGGLDPARLPPDTKLVIVTPSHHIPTGATMSLQRRQDLLARASRDDFLIVEDDYDFEMSYLAPPASPLKSLDRAGRVVYLGSFSKSLFPGLRIGYMVADAALIARARALRAIMLRHPPNHLQRITAYFLALGHYDSHIVRLRGALMRRREVMETAIADSSLRLAGVSSSGGAGLWVEGPAGVDSRVLARQLEADRVLIEPGDVFFENPPDPCNFFRLGFSSIQEEDIAPGIALIDRRARELAAQTPPAA